MQRPFAIRPLSENFFASVGLLWRCLPCHAVVWQLQAGLSGNNKTPTSSGCAIHFCNAESLPHELRRPRCAQAQAYPGLLTSGCMRSCLKAAHLSGCIRSAWHSLGDSILPMPVTALQAMIPTVASAAYLPWLAHPRDNPSLVHNEGSKHLCVARQL